jgi:hypothetical protein
VVSQLLSAEGLVPHRIEIDLSSAGDLVAGFTYGEERRLELTAARGLAVAAKVGAPVYIRRRVTRTLSVAPKDADVSTSQLFYAPPSSLGDLR